MALIALKMDPLLSLSARRQKTRKTNSHFKLVSALSLSYSEVNATPSSPIQTQLNTKVPMNVPNNQNKISSDLKTLCMYHV